MGRDKVRTNISRPKNKTNDDISDLLRSECSKIGTQHNFYYGMVIINHKWCKEYQIHVLGSLMCIWISIYS